MFDCSLGSTLGFSGATLLEFNLTGVAVAVKDMTKTPNLWRVGAVPLLSLLRS